jgi:hypothetical protein
MINTPDLISFLQKGQSLCDIQIGQTRQEIVSKFGRFAIHYGDNNVGYYELPKGIRVGYTGNIVDELAILNKREDAVFKLYVTDLLETFVIGPTTTIQEAVKFLNWSGTGWSITDTTNKFNLTIMTNANVGLTFDLEDGELMIISQRILI